MAWCLVKYRDNFAFALHVMTVMLLDEHDNCTRFRCLPHIKRRHYSEGVSVTFISGSTTERISIKFGSQASKVKIVWRF